MLMLFWNYANSYGEFTLYTTFGIIPQLPTFLQWQAPVFLFDCPKITGSAAFNLAISFQIKTWISTKPNIVNSLFTPVHNQILE